MQAFLATHRSIGGGATTHTSLSGGKWTVPSSQYELFLDLVARQLNHGIEMDLVEFHKLSGPVLIDLDFRQTCPDRLYTRDQVDTFVDALIHQLTRLCPDALPDAFDCYLLEKGPRPRPDGRGGAGLKDGIHLHMPLLWTQPCVQYELRARLLATVGATFTLAAMDASMRVEDVYDNHVIEGGWLMSGSRKPDEPCAWTPTALYRLTAAQDGATTVRRQAVVPELTRRQAVSLFSLRSCLVDTQHPAGLEELRAAWPDHSDRAAAQAATVETRRAARASRSITNTYVPMPLVLLTDLVMALPGDTFHGPGTRDRWIRVIFAIRHVSLEGGYEDAGRDLAHGFSAQSQAKGQWKAVESLWRSEPVGQPVTAGSLIQWVKESGAYEPFRARLRRGDVPKPDDWDSDLWTSLLHDVLHKAHAAGRLTGPPAWCDDFSELPTFSFTNTHILFDSTSCSGSVSHVSSAVMVTGVDGVVGHIIHPRFSATDIASVDPKRLSITEVEWTSDRPLHTDDLVVLTSDNGAYRMEWKRPHLPGSFLTLKRSGVMDVALNAKKTMVAMERVYKDGMSRDYLMCGITSDMFVNAGRDIISAGRDIIINNTIVAPPPPNEFGVLRCDLVAAAVQGRLLKGATSVFRPVEGCPCAYVEDVPFDAYINRVVGQSPLLLNNVHRFKELRTYLEKCDEAAFPKMQVDRGILSFRNGVLRLHPSLQFLPYHVDGDSAWDAAQPWAQGKIARHHIDAVYTGDTRTPLIDQMLADQQMPADVVQIMYALLGRTLFAVGAHDRWDVMAYFKGVAGSGKSTIVSILLELFSADAQGTIDSTYEAKYGLWGLYQKMIVACVEVPPNMGKLLNQQDFQKMVCGELTSVARKYTDPLSVRWSVPMVMCGNRFLDYKDDGGCISRRVVIFDFKRMVRNPQVDLQARIVATELPNIAARILRAYFDLVALHANQGFWTFCPDYLKRSREAVRVETNYVARFLAADIDDYAPACVEAVGIVHEEDSICLQEAFRKALAQYMRDNLEDDVKVKFSNLDDSAIMHAGYDVVDDHYVCKGCLQSARAGCCEGYSATNRTRRKVFKHMRLVTVRRDVM